jgi:UDP-N-acetylmuramyl pentapeptide phosphotransferase/UDP-N-acetylglucosamine-1-phosphate transferase
VILFLALAGGLSFGVLWWLLRSGRADIALDRPNERSLHTQPIPRVGGLGIMAGTMPALVLAGLSWNLALPVAGLAALSFLDDRRGLPIALRFGAHFAAALVFLLTSPGLGGGWELPLFALGVVWMTNLYNFMDGSDGLAGGMAVAGFGACSVAALLAGDHALTLAGGAVVAAALGFLWFNFHPARVFMGDAGSIPLGFLAGAIGLLGWARGVWPLWFGPVVFGPFIADASVTLLRRALRGERFWQAHRTHYYQRVVQMGFGHRRTALAAYVLMALSAGVALAVMHADAATQGLAVAGLGVVYVALGVVVDLRWRVFARRDAAG